MRNHIIVLAAQTVSLVFQPFYMPVVAFASLLTLTYLNSMRLADKLFLLLVIYGFTVLIPRLCILVYRHSRNLTRTDMNRRENRTVPYMVTLAAYVLLAALLSYIHMPRFAMVILIVAIALNIVCLALNTRFKISTHAVGAGALTGLVVVYSLLFQFSLTPWLCLSLLICGMVGSARLLLRQHTLAEVAAGTLLGFVGGMAALFIV